MAVSVISEQVHERLRLVPPEDVQPERELSPPTPEPSKPSFPTREFMASALGVLTGIAAVLSVRLVLLLAGIGAFVLAYATVQHPTAESLIAMGIYDAFVFVPMVLLAKMKG